MNVSSTEPKPPAAADRTATDECPRPQPDVAAAGAVADPARWVEDYGDYLFKYAWLRVRDNARAEDLVQETFLAALRGRQTFAGRSAEKSWLVGILKHKLLDHYRKASRETAFTDLEFYADEEGDRFLADGPFAGGWIHEVGPLEWSPDPGESLDREAFWKVFHACAGKLPRNIATVFVMREVDGVESKEICRTLAISENNLWVMLHRARMALRRCLETNWFGEPT